MLPHTLYSVLHHIGGVRHSLCLDVCPSVYFFDRFILFSQFYFYIEYIFYESWLQLVPTSLTARHT